MAPPAVELACLDGVTGPAAATVIPVTEEGFLRGDGAFEVVRVYAGRPFALDEHLDRMTASAAALRLEGGCPRAEFERDAADCSPLAAARASTAA